MSKRYVVSLCVVFAIALASFTPSGNTSYHTKYLESISGLKTRLARLTSYAQVANLSDSTDLSELRQQILQARLATKSVDFWIRYLEPQAFRRINGPLPVEWETEVFEKFEKPYRRQGAGLALALQYIDEPGPDREALLRLLTPSVAAAGIYGHDSISSLLDRFDHFYLCNRLYLLNLAAIYTTGFDCPDATQVIPELKTMLPAVLQIYRSFNESYPSTPLTETYLQRYSDMVAFVANQPDDVTAFDHYTFIRNYVNPLFEANQELIRRYHVVSRSLLDYSLNKSAVSIFDKSLYNGQDAKGVFLRVDDSAELTKIGSTGRLLFYDPILSGNNARSCASCHKPTQYFTDTVLTTAANYGRTGFLARNTPSLINASYNHLAMLDGKHISLQDQAVGVIANADEMSCSLEDALRKVMSCKDYSKMFRGLLVHTPQEKDVTSSHIVSAITYYYNKFSQGYSAFDRAMNRSADLTDDQKKGFNLFMGKAQCGTCHFVPQFNGVKPPYIGSEFEVLGVPADSNYTRTSGDAGRYGVNPAVETRNAFRTGTVRNSMHTAPYMHNGVFRSLEQVIDFYDAGGGTGHGLNVPNQTLSSDSLKLTRHEKECLIAFIGALNEEIMFETPPEHLPSSKDKKLNGRKVGGEY